MTWHCTLPGVVAARKRLLDATVALDAVLGVCEPVTKSHQISCISCGALREGRAPVASPATAALGSSSYTAETAGVAALRHLLGIVRRPDNASGFMRSLRYAKPVLRSMVAMQHAAESATRDATAVVVRRCLVQRRLRDSFGWVRQYTWLHPLEVHPTLAPAAAAARAQRVDAPPRRRLPQAHVIRHSSRLMPTAGALDEVVRAQLVPSPLAAAAWVMPALAQRPRRREESLRRLDAQLVHVAEAAVRVATRDAAAAQIVLDAQTHDGDASPVACFPPPPRRRCLLPLAQLRGAIGKPDARRPGRLLPGVAGLDEALRLQRTQLVAARDAAVLHVEAVRSSPAVQSALDFCGGWQRFRVRAGRRSACVGRRAPPALPVLPKPLSAAAKRRTFEAVRTQRATAAAVAAVLSVQPVLVRAAATIQLRCGIRAARAAADNAVARAHRITLRATGVGVAPRRACRAQVLAHVVRSRPVLAVSATAPAGRGCSRAREGDVRRAEGRRVVKAARVVDVTDTIRTVVATQCGGGKSCGSGLDAGTCSGARFCP